MRQRIQSQTERPGSTPTAVFHNGQKRKTPAPKGARVYRRMGEGLGAGGHSTRRYAFNARASPRFLRLKLFSSLASPGKAPATRARPVCLISRQFEVAAIGKLKISQTDAKASLFPAAALDHVARADREPAGGPSASEPMRFLLEATAWLGTFRHQCQNTATVPRQRDDKHRFLWIAVDKEPVTRTRVRSGTRKFRRAIGSGRRLTPRGRVQRSKPLSCAKALSGVSGRAPRCWITSAATSAPSRAASR